MCVLHLPAGCSAPPVWVWPLVTDEPPKKLSCTFCRPCSMTSHPLRLHTGITSRWLGAEERQTGFVVVYILYVWDSFLILPLCNIACNSQLMHRDQSTCGNGLVNPWNSLKICMWTFNLFKLLLLLKGSKTVFWERADIFQGKKNSIVIGCLSKQRNNYMIHILEMGCRQCGEVENKTTHNPWLIWLLWVKPKSLH